MLRGYEAELKTTKDPRGKVRKATAATPRVLRQMIAATDTGTLIGARDAAALTNGFALAARSSEAALLDWEDAAEADDDQGLLYDLYRPKVTNDQPLGVPYGSYASTCPVRTLRTYRQALLDHGHKPTGPMFVRIDRHGRINPPMFRDGRRIGDPSGRMTAEGIADIVTRAAARAGLAVRPDRLFPEGTPAGPATHCAAGTPKPPATPKRTRWRPPATAGGPTAAGRSPATTTAPPRSMRSSTRSTASACSSLRRCRSQLPAAEP